jgi:hypothetical protein
LHRCRWRFAPTGEFQLWLFFCFQLRWLPVVAMVAVRVFSILFFFFNCPLVFHYDGNSCSVETLFVCISNHSNLCFNQNSERETPHVGLHSQTFGIIYYKFNQSVDKMPFILCITYYKKHVQFIVLYKRKVWLSANES